MEHMLHRHCLNSLPMAVQGDGVYIVDANGRRYLDGCGGAAVSCLGHNHPRIIDAIKKQLDQIPFAHTGFFTNDSCERLADLLIGHAPQGIEKVYLVSGGSEAVESALKIARQYAIEIGEPARHHFIARRQSYHGNTLGALSVGGNMWRRQPFDPIMMPGHHISPCYAYRDLKPGETEEQYGLRVANELEAMIQQLGSETVLAFVAEPVVGATAGAVTAVPGYFKRVREICDQYGILLILDEVMCGMGRTGTLFACEQEGVVPDIVTQAKGLGAGYQPIGAMMISAKIYDALRDGSGYFQHGHTYMAHATAAAAAVEVLQTIEDENLLDQVKQQGQTLRNLLLESFGQHPYVGDIRGRGLFIGLELVQDRQTKEPFSPASQLAAVVKKQALSNGLMCYPMGGTIDGEQGHHILLAPPFIVTDAQLQELVEKLSLSLDQALDIVRQKQ